MGGGRREEGRGGKEGGRGRRGGKEGGGGGDRSSSRSSSSSETKGPRGSQAPILEGAKHHFSGGILCAKFCSLNTTNND